MSKDFKEGEYYVFSDTKKKAGKATIYGFVQVNGKPYAVMTITDEASTPVARLIKHDNDRAYIEVFSGCLNADAPVLPKVVKFKIGETYIDDKFALLTVTAKYTDSVGTTYIVLGNKYIAAVHKIDVYGDVVEYANFLNLEKGLIRKIFANKTFGD